MAVRIVAHAFEIVRRPKDPSSLDIRPQSLTTIRST
jgi:hypothetical protein